MKKYLRAIVTAGIVGIMIFIWCVSNGVIKLNKIEAGIKSAYYNNATDEEKGN